MNYNNDLIQNTGGLTVGDPVLKTGKPLSVELGPGASFCFLFLGCANLCAKICAVSQCISFERAIAVNLKRVNGSRCLC